MRVVKMVLYLNFLAALVASTLVAPQFLFAREVTESCFCPGQTSSDFAIERCPSQVRDACFEHSCSYITPTGLLIDRVCGTTATEYCDCDTSAFPGNTRVIEFCPGSVKRGSKLQCGNYQCKVLTEIEPGYDIVLGFPCVGY